MQHLEVSGAVRHIYICVVRRLRVNISPGIRTLPTFKASIPASNHLRGWRVIQ